MTVQEVNEYLRKQKRRPKKSTQVDDFTWDAFGLPRPEREFRFHQQRRWRFDYCWPNAQCAVEIEGVNPNGKSRHTSVVGYRKDCEKYNAAQELGWVVLRYLQKEIDYEQVARVYWQRVNK